MRPVHESISRLGVDINWIGVEELLELIAQRSAIAWFMLLTGVTVRDPKGRAESAVAAWFDATPVVLNAWQDQQRDVEAFKNRRSPLEFATQSAFVEHLVRRVA